MMMIRGWYIWSRAAASLAVALVVGCRDEPETSATESSTNASSDGPDTGGTTLGSTAASASTDDTGRSTDTGTDTHGSTLESTSSGDATSRGSTGSSTDTGSTTGDSTGTEGTTSGSTGTEGTTSGSTESSGTTSGSTGTEGTTGGSTSTGGTTGGSTESSGTESSGTESSGTESSGTESSDTGETSECAFSESFDGIPNGSPWPAPWIPTGGIALADVQGGRGRVLPITSSYGLGRMFVPLPETCVDVEGTLTFELTDSQSSGVGLYLRHNGGFLQETVPPGHGFVAFVQAFGIATGISFWRELDGVETVLAPYVPQVILTHTLYRLRYRVTQQDASTIRLRARVWPIEGIEPGVWHVDLTDVTPSLQGVGGGLCVDVWTQFESGTAADVFVDDIVVGPVP